MGVAVELVMPAGGSWFKLTLCLLLGPTAADRPIQFGRSVTILNGRNFDALVTNDSCGDGMECPRGKLWVVDFYAPWCPHCRHFAPIWGKVAGQYAHIKPLGFGAVDCEENGRLCDR